MPKRLVADFSDDSRFDDIEASEERLYLRIFLKADDFGRFHADPRLIRGACFPLIESILTTDIRAGLDELEKRGLIALYEASGKPYLVIIDFGQRLKSSKAKFPPLPGKPDNWLATSVNVRNISDDSAATSGNQTDNSSDATQVGRTSLASSGNFPEDLGTNKPEVEGELEEGKNSYVLLRETGGVSEPPKAYHPFVEEVWSMTPVEGRNRSSKKKLADAWAKTKPKPTENEVRTALVAWCASEQWTKENGRFVPAIDRWVRERKWETPPALKTSNPTKTNKFNGNYTVIND